MATKDFRVFPKQHKKCWISWAHLQCLVIYKLETPWICPKCTQQLQGLQSLKFYLSIIFYCFVTAINGLIFNYFFKLVGLGYLFVYVNFILFLSELCCNF